MRRRLPAFAVGAGCSRRRRSTWRGWAAAAAAGLVAVGLGAAAGLAGAAEAQQRGFKRRRSGQRALEVDITQGTLKPIPIADPGVCRAKMQRFAVELSNVVAADLERSGLFQPLDRRLVHPAIGRPQRHAALFRIGAPSMPRRWWSAVPAARPRRPAGRRVSPLGRPFRAPAGRPAARRRVAGEWRRLGHLIADQIYERLTGEKGYFDTQIVFIDETGPKDHRNKRLAIMDQDGANVRLLSQGRELVLTPRFSPSSHEVTFLQYTGDQPRVFLLNLESGRRELVGNFPGMTFAPRFSPDGQRIIMSIGEGGASSIVEMDLRSRQSAPSDPDPIRSIPVPATARTARRVVFRSDRDGLPAALRHECRRLRAAPHQLR